MKERTGRMLISRLQVLFAMSCLVLLVATPVALSQEKPMIRIVATGGTIAHTESGRIDGSALTTAIPELSEHADISVEEYSRIISTEFAVADMLGLSRRVQAILNEEKVDGVVVTMGSNAIEEMAYFLNLTIKSDKPVVFTGAQRKHGTPGSEGEKNLLESVRVAAFNESRGKGVLVVVNDEIHAARDVTKEISYRTDTWSSGDLGNLGLVDSDRISFYRKTLKTHTTDSEFDIANLEGALPEVPIIYSYLGADGTLVRAAVREGGARGIVIAGFPSGAPARPLQHDALDEVSGEGVVVVISHRGGAGRVRESYASLASQIEADNLSPQKARILLMLVLTATTDLDDIQAYFDRY